MGSLKGKTAFVSGGTRGIGLAIAKRLASEGADIMVAGSSEANCAAATRAITAQSVSYTHLTLPTRNCV